MSETPVWGTPPDTTGQTRMIGQPRPARPRWSAAEEKVRRALRRTSREPTPGENLRPLLPPVVGVTVSGGAKLVALSPSGRFLVTCSSGLFAYTLRVWDLYAGCLLWSCGTGEEPTALLIDDNLRVVTGGESKLVQYDLPRQRSKGYRRLGAVSALALHPDGRHLVAGTFGGQVAVVPLTFEERPNEVVKAGTAVTALSLDVEGSRIAAGDAMGGVRVWDMPRRVLMLDVEHAPKADVQEVLFRPDAGILESTGAEGSCRRWHLGSSRLLDTFTVAGARQMVLDPHSDAVAVRGDGHDLVIWDRAARGPAVELGEGSRTRALTASSGGGRLAGATGDGMVWIWPWPR